MKYTLPFILCLLSSCCYNVSLVHTEGVAEDVIDENASNTPNISPNIELPLIPKGP